jgi:hypothetical protein
MMMSRSKEKVDCNLNESDGLHQPLGLGPELRPDDIPAVLRHQHDVGQLIIVTHLSRLSQNTKKKLNILKHNLIPGPAPPKWGHPRWMNSPQEAPPKFVVE